MRPFCSLTKDVTPFVGVLEAEQRLDRQQYGLPEEGTLWDPEASADDAPPDRSPA